MGRTIVRVTLGVVGATLLLIGVGAAAAGLWITATVGTQDALRATPQLIDVPGCSTVVMEIADARLDIDQLDNLDPLTERAETMLTIGIDGETSTGWLVGVASQSDVEERLLGARYCLIEVRDGAWSFISIAMEPDASDVDLSGIPGQWAEALSGEPVAVRLPSAGESVVISGSNESTMATLDITGEYRIPGVSDVGRISLIAGTVTSVVGVVLLVVSIVGLRNRGQHEGAHREPVA